MSTFIIGLLVFCALGFASYKIYKNKKAGQCAGGCGGCESSCSIKNKV